ncbi:hypothetical protein QJS10_CPA01g02706 [Acorus calamus]|uniref:Uncharacterized protein n=1 Tax=Acorus calamus TaxID=4465 RepID=A0AAV9FKI9_ACOCL|nr:hypothetical protein QJS10_CPA01g02706 [Acorus calamus]
MAPKAKPPPFRLPPLTLLRGARHPRQQNDSHHGEVPPLGAQALANVVRRESRTAASEAEAAVPKGYMAVYVGWKGAEDRPSRFLVPVMYFNDPLFGGLLKEAEEEFGYDHPGGITIPCRISEFESVRGRIAAARGFSRRRLRRI